MERVRFNSVKLNNKIVQKMQDGFIIGTQGNNKIGLNIIGRPSLEDCLDMLNTAQMEVLNTFLIIATQDIEDPAIIKEIKNDLWSRANLGAGIMLDKFFPEGKDTKYAGLTNEAILEAQNAILSRR